MTVVSHHNFVERNSGEPGTVPPPSELEILEPILEREPAESVDNEFPLFEVRGGVNYREVAGHRAHRAQLRTGGHPAAVLPVVGLQAPADTQLASYHGKSNVEVTWGSRSWSGRSSCPGTGSCRGQTGGTSSSSGYFGCCWLSSLRPGCVSAVPPVSPASC